MKLMKLFAVLALVGMSNAAFGSLQCKFVNKTNKLLTVMYVTGPKENSGKRYDTASNGLGRDILKPNEMTSGNRILMQQDADSPCLLRAYFAYGSINSSNPEDYSYAQDFDNVCGGALVLHITERNGKLGATVFSITKLPQY